MGSEKRNIAHAAKAGAAAAVVLLLLPACDGGRGPTAPSPTPGTYTLSGTVREPPPNPETVPDMRIEVIDGPNAGRFTTTDREGQYVLSSLLAGTFHLRASRSGYRPVEQTITLSSNTTLDLSVVRGCALRGVVRESPGDALSVGAVLKLVKQPGGRSAPVIDSATTDATGTYRLGIECGVSRLLRVEKPDFFVDEVSVRSLDDTQRDFTIQRVTYLLAGIVRESPSGTWLADAIVEVVSGPYAGQKATTHHDGSYGLSVRDTVTVRASKPGYVSQEATVTVTFPAAYKDFSLTRRASAP